MSIRLVSGRFLSGGVLYAPGDELPDGADAHGLVARGLAVEDMPPTARVPEPVVEDEPDAAVPEAPPAPVKGGGRNGRKHT